MAGREQTDKTLTMVSEALADGRVLLALQPVVMGHGDRRPAFFEGLIRLQDRAGRVIPAAQFIDIVEDHGLGRQIDRAALALGLDELRADPGLRLSINISPLSIGCPDWLRALERALAADPTIGERLIVEITERVAMRTPGRVRRFIERLHRHGISVALDDFGAGQTSFRHLREFRFDIIKIDGLFSRGVARDPDAQALVRALVGLSQHFEMLVVAEHVACAADADSLAGLGVDCLQGFHFGAPRPTDLPQTGPDQATA